MKIETPTSMNTCHFLFPTPIFIAHSIVLIRPRIWYIVLRNKTKEKERYGNHQ
jgi:hypothetical protein